MTDEKNKNEQLLALERSLREGLSPVAPRQAFVGTLRTRLEDSPIYQKKRRMAATLLTVAGGVVFGLSVFLIARGFMQGPGKA